jgi:hypothetical protein
MNRPAGQPEALRDAPRCGAKNRKGNPCQAPAIHGKARCRLHGGLSTGPKTEDGRERCRMAKWKHGYYSAEQKEARRQVRELIEKFEATIDVAKKAS